MNMNLLSDRIKIILQEMRGPDHGKQTKLARIAGVSKQVANHWISGFTSTMDYEAARLIHERLGYRAEWLITGKGPMRDGEENAIVVEAEPPRLPDTPATKELQPQQEGELFLIQVNLNELRLITSYRKRPDQRQTLDGIAKILNEWQDE